ncbi:TPA: fimbrial protein [Pseudomonas aeruginosa]|nr:fimbrial protein [Pseudomonas aeruginosa]HCF5273080.1 fimbrial protein [Pseudomonas aeruginosa]HCF7348817.1 fimbrial protein [Pseudomonas aeruginosa]HCF7352301.1 fimbrial protein [Pseudomonas aeruginosa]
MKIIYLICVCALGSVFFPENSYALNCLKDGSVASEVTNIGSTIAVPTDAQKGRILWRSPKNTIKITCFQEGKWSSGEDVYIYLSPTDPNMVQLGEDLQFGAGVGGQDYACGSVAGCRIKLGRTEPCISLSSVCKGHQSKFNFTFDFFIAKKSTAAASAGKDGPLTGLSTYAAFQIDGEGGINSVAGKNFRMTVSGLDKIRYIGCLANLRVSPETINFGFLSADGARAGKTIIDQPFNIVVSKTCNSVYALDAVLTPVNGSVPDGYTLVPAQNASVGISLLRDSGDTVPFFQTFSLTEPSGDLVLSKRFIARLKWMSNVPALGGFNAGAMLDVYYK